MKTASIHLLNTKQLRGIYMNKKELKKTIESETVQFSDMSSKNSYIHIESAINVLTQHNRSQVLVDLISEFWELESSKR